MNTIKKRLSFLNPIDLLIWIVLGFFWLLTHLPISTQMRIGRFIGWIIYHSASKLKHLTEVNIKLCFPEFSETERTALTKRSFANVGVGIIETAMAWWLPESRLQKCAVTVTGVEYADAAFAKGKGIILLGPHFTCLEMVGRLLGSRYSFAVMYRPHKKELISRIQARFRKKYGIKQIARHRMRELLRTLNENTAVWYAYDIDGGEKRSVFAPFFGIQTATLTAVSRVAELSGATVIPINFYRHDDCWRYEINLSPAIENFPTADLQADATRLNASLEKAVRTKPDQYIWQYKRFKTRPSGEKRFY